MGANRTTERKINEMLDLMREGKSAREIAKLKFKGSPKYYLEFLERNKEAFADFQEYFLIDYPGKKSEAEDKKNEIVSGAIKTAQNSVVNFSEYKIESMKKDELKKLNPDELSRLLIFFAPDILEMLSSAKNIQKINKFIDEKDHLIKLDDVLAVPQELIKLPDAVPRSFKFSKKIMKDFDKVASQYSQYTKQTLLNLALKEFAEKYDKKKK